MSCINLRISVPFCSFRKPYAREYLESERFPPPATVYGFVLSLVGEEDRYEYAGTELAIAITHEPSVAQLLRTVWRAKYVDIPPGTGNNRIPDYQEVLSGLEMGIWVAEGTLADRLRKAADDPKSVTRFGGLSLGESRDLVNEVCFDPDWLDGQGVWVVRDPNGRTPVTCLGRPRGLQRDTLGAVQSAG